MRSAAGSLWGLATERLPRNTEMRSLAWKLRLVPRDRKRPQEAVQVFLGEQSAAVADGRHWLHEATYWLRHEANAELNVILPAAGRVVAASVDGIAVVPLQPQPDLTRLWLPLPRRPGVRWVRLRWVYDEEPLTAPNLTRPTLEGTALVLRCGPSISRMASRLNNNAAWNCVRDSFAVALDLYRAEAQGQIVRKLAEEFADGKDDAETRSDLEAAQRRFYQYSRQAEHLLEGVPSGKGEEIGPEEACAGRAVAGRVEENAPGEQPRPARTVGEADRGTGANPRGGGAVRGARSAHPSRA